MWIVNDVTIKDPLKRPSFFTPPRTKNKWNKISGLETNIFGLKIMLKSGLDFFYFEIPPAPSQLLLPSAKKSAQKD